MDGLFTYATAAFCFAFLFTALSVAYMIFFCSDSGEQNRCCIVLPVSGHVEDIELQVRAAVSRRRKLRNAAIFLADFGADSETAEIGRRLCREFAMVEWMSPDLLDGRLREMAGAIVE